MVLYVDTSSNQLLASLDSLTVVNPTSLPFYAGDTGLTLQIYFLVPLIAPEQNQWNYSIILTPGNTCIAQIDDGTYGGNVFTNQTIWGTDPNNQYFIANLPMNTNANVGGGGSGILGLFSGGKSIATAYLRIGLYVSGLPFTTFAQPINIKPGIPGQAIQVAAPLTPLSLEVAKALFVPQSGGNNGQGFFLLTPTGKKIFVQAVDNVDGDPSLGVSPSN